MSQDPATRSAPDDPGPGQPIAPLDFRGMTREAMLAFVDEALAAAERRADDALRDPEADFETVFGGLDEAIRHVAAARGRGVVPRYVDPDPDRRAAAQAASDRIGEWRARLRARPELARAVAHASTRVAGLDPEQAGVLRCWRMEVRLAGGGLPPEARAQLLALADELPGLQAAFFEALGDYPAITVRRDALAGLPDYLAGAVEDGPDPDTATLTLTDPVYLGIADHVRDRATRELALRVAYGHGGEAQRARLEQMVAIRRRMAELLGEPSWGELRTRDRMAGGAGPVRAFLDDLHARLAPFQAREVAAMAEVLEAETGDRQVQAWDVRYLEERQREALGVEPDALRDWFELDGVLERMDGIVRDLFGVRIEPRPDLAGWHPDVRGYDMFDERTGDRLAVVFFDLFARDGKTGGAYTDVLLPGSRTHAVDEPPVLLLALGVAPPEPGAATTLPPVEVAGLFHEYGHLVNFGLSFRRGRFMYAGDEWLPMDFGEAPSQFLEHWVMDPVVLGRLGRHRVTGDPMPAELIESLGRVQRLNHAMAVARLLHVAVFDQVAHGPDAVDLAALDAETWRYRGTPYPGGIFFPGSIAHLADGYDGVFYSYSWALVLAADLETPFREHGMLDPDVGAAYRRQILEAPLLADPMLAVGGFLGREPSSDALFAHVAAGHPASG